MGLPAATVTQKIGFQFFSVALDAIQFPLSLSVLSSGHGSGPQAAHEASALPGGWAESLGLEVRTSMTHPGELLHHLLCSDPLDHLGQDRQIRLDHNPTPDPSGSPLTTEILGLTPKSFMSFSTFLYRLIPHSFTPSSHCLTLASKMGAKWGPSFLASRFFAYTLFSCFTCLGLCLGIIAFRKHSLSFSSLSPPLITALVFPCLPLVVW